MSFFNGCQQQYALKLQIVLMETFIRQKIQIFLQVISLCDLPEYHCVPHKINTKC